MGNKMNKKENPNWVGKEAIKLGYNNGWKLKWNKIKEEIKDF